MSDGGFLRGPASTAAQASTSGGGMQSRLDEPAPSPQIRDEDRAHADLGRAAQLVSSARRLEQVAPAEWAAKKAALAQQVEDLAGRLQAVATDAAPSERAEADRGQAAAKLAEARALLDQAKPPRAVPAVAGEEALEPRLADKSIAPEEVVDWMGGLSKGDRETVWRRYGEAHGNRADTFAVALANYVARHRDRAPPLSEELRDLARMKPREHAAWQRDRAAMAPAAAAEPPAPDASPVQHRLAAHDVARSEDADASADVSRAAARGVRGASERLPHHDAIQASFGRHEVGGIQAFVGGAAAEATQAMGAEAYASGNAVAFGAAPDLHTAAHEAAHVVQQRGGVQLKGGVGEAGDPYEQHADAVADRVVAGQSAESLLDERAGPPAASAPALQRKLANHKPPAPPGPDDPLVRLHGMLAGLLREYEATEAPELVQRIHDVSQRLAAGYESRGMSGSESHVAAEAIRLDAARELRDLGAQPAAPIAAPASTSIWPAPGGHAIGGTPAGDLPNWERHDAVGAGQAPASAAPASTSIWPAPGGHTIGGTPAGDLPNWERHDAVGAGQAAPIAAPASTSIWPAPGGPTIGGRPAGDLPNWERHGAVGAQPAVPIAAPASTSIWPAPGGHTIDGTPAGDVPNRARHDAVGAGQAPPIAAPIRPPMRPQGRIMTMAELLQGDGRPSGGGGLGMRPNGNGTQTMLAPITATPTSPWPSAQAPQLDLAPGAAAPGSSVSASEAIVAPAGAGSGGLGVGIGASTEAADEDALVAAVIAASAAGEEYDPSTHGPFAADADDLGGPSNNNAPPAYYPPNDNNAPALHHDAPAPHHDAPAPDDDTLVLNGLEAVSTVASPPDSPPPAPAADLAGLGARPPRSMVIYRELRDVELVCRQVESKRLELVAAKVADKVTLKLLKEQRDALRAKAEALRAQLAAAIREEAGAASDLALPGGRGDKQGATGAQIKLLTQLQERGDALVAQGMPPEAAYLPMGQHRPDAASHEAALYNEVTRFRRRDQGPDPESSAATTGLKYANTAVGGVGGAYTGATLVAKTATGTERTDPLFGQLGAPADGLAAVGDGLGVGTGLSQVAEGRQLLQGNQAQQETGQDKVTQGGRAAGMGAAGLVLDGATMMKDIAIATGDTVLSEVGGHLVPALGVVISGAQAGLALKDAHEAHQKSKAADTIAREAEANELHGPAMVATSVRDHQRTTRNRAGVDAGVHLFSAGASAANVVPNPVGAGLKGAASAVKVAVKATLFVIDNVKAKRIQEARAAAELGDLDAIEYLTHNDPALAVDGLIMMIREGSDADREEALRICEQAIGISRGAMLDPTATIHDLRQLLEQKLNANLEQHTLGMKLKKTGEKVKKGWNKFKAKVKDKFTRGHGDNDNNAVDEDDAEESEGAGRDSEGSQ